MSSRTIVVSSRALGERKKVTVKVYDTPIEMRRAAVAYNGSTDITEEGDTLGVTQLSRFADTHRIHQVIVRIARGHLSTQIVGHEMHHASTAIYGDHVGARITTGAHLNHYNEPFAHLFSDLLTKLVDRLYDLGYYPQR